MNEKIVYTVTAPAGAGKTYGLVQDHTYRAKTYQHKFLIALPSKILGAEVEQAAKNSKHECKVTRIDSDTDEHHVLSAIMEHFKTAEKDEGEVLIITTSAFFSLPYYPKGWKLTIDEPPDPITDLSGKFAETHNAITQAIKLESYNVNFQKMNVIAGQESLLNRYVRNNKKDAVWALFEPIAKRITSPYYDVYVNTVNHNKVLNRKTNKEDDRHIWNVYSYLHHSILDDFDEVTIIGANFEETPLYLLWSQRGVTFKPHRMQKKLRYTKHENGHLLTIVYLTEKDYSKTFRDKLDRKAFKLLKKEAEHIMGVDDAEEGEEEGGEHSPSHQPYLCIANNDIPDADLPKGATRVPVVCHGLNAYSGYHNIVYLCAMNATPAANVFAQTMGLTSDEVTRAMYGHAVYQATLRSSLRNPADDNPKMIVVPDKRAADYLAPLFPGCTVRRGDMMPKNANKGPGRDRVWKDDAARTKASNEKKRLIKELVSLGDIPKKMTLFSSIYSKFADDLVEINSNRALMAELKKMVSIPVRDKTTHMLVCPATFKKVEGSDKARGLENVEHLSGIWLDNDTGAMTPDDFREMFPNLWFAAFNTHTNCARYRIFIPTKQVMTAEVDGKIKEIIKRKITDHNWLMKDPRSDDAQAQAREREKAAKQAERDAEENATRSGRKYVRQYQPKEYYIEEARKIQDYKGRIFCGLDSSKFAPSSLFYLPCKHPDDPYSFFTEYAGEELDPVTWLENSTIAELFDPEPEYVPLPYNPEKDVVLLQQKAEAGGPGSKLAEVRLRLALEGKQMGIDAAVKKYHAIPIGAGLRHKEFFKLGLACKRAGCDEMEIRNILMQNTGGDTERIGEVPRVIQSLRNPKWG